MQPFLVACKGLVLKAVRPGWTAVRHMRDFFVGKPIFL